MLLMLRIFTIYRSSFGTWVRRVIVPGNSTNEVLP
jgi:hypothetical protein